MRALDKLFKITDRGSSVGQEIRGGAVTFFAMSYIIVLNPIILSGFDTQGNLLDPDGTGRIAAMTALIAGITTILMGLIANFPIGLAAGLGTNSVIAVSAATLGNATWADIMGLVVIEGAIILILVLTGFRKLVFDALPQSLRVGIGVGIGLFIALIGLWDSGFLTAGPGTPTQIQASGSINSVPVLIFVLCFFTVLVLSIKRVKGAVIISIVGFTILSIILELIFHFGTLDLVDGGWKSNLPVVDQSLINLPDFSLFGKFNILGSFKSIGIVTAALLMFSLLLSDFFDTVGTVIAVSKEGKIVDKEGNPLNTQRILVADSIAAIAGGAGSVSSNTSFVESTAGVAEGARTGFASVVTGILFLLATFLAPLTTLVPAEVTTSVLVFVGFLMFGSITEIDWKDWTIALPAFVTIILMPFAYSITAGIGAGLITHVIVKAFTNRAREIHPLIWGISALFLVYFAQAPINALVGGF